MLLFPMKSPFVRVLILSVQDRSTSRGGGGNGRFYPNGDRMQGPTRQSPPLPGSHTHSRQVI